MSCQKVETIFPHWNSIMIFLCGDDSQVKLKGVKIFLRIFKLEVPLKNIPSHPWGSYVWTEDESSVTWFVKLAKQSLGTCYWYFYKASALGEVFENDSPRFGKKQCNYQKSYSLRKIWRNLNWMRQLQLTWRGMSTFASRSKVLLRPRSNRIVNITSYFT